MWLMYFLPHSIQHIGIFVQPTLPHTVNPNYQFALRDNAMFQAAQEKMDFIVDLDETSSIPEYSKMFAHSLQLEYEEHLRLYELYSLYHVNMRLIDECPHPKNRGSFNTNVHKLAQLFIDGIADARPTLQIGDIVLLRPISALGQVHLEIESRIVRVVRGHKQHADAQIKDQVIITWGLTPEQMSELSLINFDSTRIKFGSIKFNVRFIPSSAQLERCLTALDWLNHVSKRFPRAMDDVLFPVKAPEVKPLSIQQAQRMKQDDSDMEKPLNELQSSFVKMVGARTRDPEFNTIRPPMILTGPAGKIIYEYQNS
jgi:hypothetical protein